MALDSQSLSSYRMIQGSLLWSLNHDRDMMSHICLDVRFRGQSGRRMVLRRESANDPKRTCEIFLWILQSQMSVFDP